MISVNGEKVIVGHFPDGTQNIKFGATNVCNDIFWRYESEEELATLIYITKHIKNSSFTSNVKLTIPYVSNGRMDRVHKEREEVFTLKYFCDVINWLEFDSVYILDPHSNVAPALIKNVITINAEHYIYETLDNIISNKGLNNTDDIVLYFPDNGSIKRINEEFLKRYKFCYGEKKRDWNTGKITGLDINLCGISIKDKTILMVDDICSYGGTYYYSAKRLKEHEAGDIFAYATHTENSVLDEEKGTLIKLLDDGIVSGLYTTNSLFSGKHKNITVMEAFR